MAAPWRRAGTAGFCTAPWRPGRTAGIPVYVFTFGEIAVIDQDLAPLPDAGEWEDASWEGQDLRTRDAPAGTDLLYQPSGGEGLAYLASYDDSLAYSDAAALLLSLEIG